MIPASPLQLLFANLCAFVVLAGLNPASGMTANPQPFSVKQADGSEAQVRVRGNQSFHWLEDTAGYTLVPRQGIFHYAQLDAAGNTSPGNLRLGRDDPAAHGLTKHLLPAPGLRLRKFQASAAAGDAAGGTSSEVSGRVAPNGTVRNLVVLCRFSDHTLGVHTRPEADYDTIFNAVGGHATLAPTGSVRDFYTENSYGAMTLQSNVTVWVTLPHTEAYYANGQDGGGAYPNNAQKMVEDALALADATVNFAQFDADNDGFVDAIDIIHSGYGAEAGGGGGNWIWSHRWALPANWTSADNNGSGVKVKVRDYHTEPALWGVSGTEPVRIGVICHETGHFFGLPDLYDTDNTSEGIGSWCLMANSWGFDFSQRHPPHFSAWCKAQLGWVTPQLIGAGSHSAGRVETSQIIYKIQAGFPNGEYLLVENRQPFGFESDMPQGGLAIWHIDENKADNNAEGYPGQSGWPGNNNHYKIALLQADGAYHMEHGSNRGDGGDVFRSGGVTTINSSTVPDTKSYQGGTVTSSGVVIGSISASGAEMTFDLSFDSAAPEMNVTGNGVTIADGDSSPSSADFTSFGSASVTGGTVVRTFTVQNFGAGPLNLTGVPKVVIGGTNAADFIVTQEPASPVAAAVGVTTLQITFDPSASGTRSATVSIANDDANENPYNFSINGVGAAPEINLQGGGLNISDGDSNPRTADGTDFGSTSVGGGAVAHSFTIQNNGAGSLNLTGNPRVVVGGTNAADFRVTVQPASPVAGSSSTTFTVVFDPSASGVRNATLSIDNDDSNENPYNISIRGTGTLPEINVTGSGSTIANGDITPSAADFTDFGSVAAASGSVGHVFVIENSGPGNLNLSGNPRIAVTGPNAADFAVTVLPADSVGTGATTTFEITFDPLSGGIRQAAVSIANDDADENPYTFSIRGFGMNSAPTDIIPSNASFAENNPPGSTVATLNGTDPDAGDTLVFALVSGDGDADNAAFSVSGSELRFVGSANYETKSSYSIRLRTTDLGGLVFEKAFVINVTNENEAPVELMLSANVLAENSPTDSVIGMLATMDPDAGDTITFTLTPGEGDADNAEFSVVGTELRLTASANFEAKASYSVRIRAADYGGLGVERTFEIAITDINEPPTLLTLSGNSVAENSAPGTVVGGMVAVDPDAGDSQTFSLASGDGDADNVAFAISGNDLLLVPSADFESQAAYHVRIRVTDSGGLSVEREFTVAITDFPENQSPVWRGCTLAGQKGAALTVAKADLLTHATDADGGALSIQVANVSSQGGALEVGEETLTYTPPPGFAGVDLVPVVISDGQGGTAAGTIFLAIFDGPPPAEPQPMMSALPNGGLAFVFFGVPKGEYSIQRSTDLETWQPLRATTASDDGSVGFVDAEPPVQRGLYRCVPAASP